MSLTGIIISAGVMASISAYMLFKVGENKAGDDYNLSSGLQALFFFMVLANFVLMGSAGYESRNDCDYLLMNSTIDANVTSNVYDYVCTERIPNSSSWVYRLPVWLTYISAGYIVVYLLMLIGMIWKKSRNGGKHG